MLDNPLDLVADRVARFIIEHGATRLKIDGDNRLGGYVTVEQLCFELNIEARSEWPKLKRWMIDHGYPIAYLPGKGHYMGEAGEETLNDFYRFRTALAYSRKLPGLQDRIKRMQRADNPGWKFLQKTYGVNDLTQLETENLKRVKADERKDGKHD